MKRKKRGREKKVFYILFHELIHLLLFIIVERSIILSPSSFSSFFQFSSSFFHVTFFSHEFLLFFLSSLIQFFGEVFLSIQLIVSSLCSIELLLFSWPLIQFNSLLHREKERNRKEEREKD